MAFLSSSRTGSPVLNPWAASRQRATGVLALASAAALCAARLLSPADAAHGPVVCPFRLLTGLPCPGCGMTRAWVFLMHGQVRGAVAANPFGLVTLPVTVALVLTVAVALVRRRPLPDPGRALRHPASMMLLLVFIVFGAVRIVATLRG